MTIALKVEIRYGDKLKKGLKRILKLFRLHVLAFQLIQKLAIVLFDWLQPRMTLSKFVMPCRVQSRQGMPYGDKSHVA